MPRGGSISNRWVGQFPTVASIYLRWLERHGIEEGEASPLGLILCAEGSHEQIELLELDKTSIHVAEYLTELPPKEVLGRKLHAAIEIARAQLGQRNEV